MDGRKQRTHQTIERIKRAALDLFTAHGVDKVSMDEIAAKARVSKVTIYKHFASKDALYIDVVNQFIDETLVAAEKVLASDMDFLEKLKFPLLAQTQSAQLVSFAQLHQIWEANPQTAATLNERLQGRVKALMYRLYEEGKKKGYISEQVSFDVLYLYSEIFRAGLKATSTDHGSSPVGTEVLEELYRLYFFGFVNRQ